MSSQDHFERPSNPWGEHDVIWRDQIKEDRPNDEFHRVMADPNRTHIVREIQVLAGFLPTMHPTSISEAEDVIALGDQEFKALRKLGIEVPDIEWYATKTEHSPISTILARVPIITGEHCDVSDNEDAHLPKREITRLSKILVTYALSRKAGQFILSDLEGGHQYVHGNYRHPEQTNRQVPIQAILVDPDLVFHKITEDEHNTNKRMELIFWGNV